MQINQKECRHCCSIIRIGASKCPYCQGDQYGSTSSGQTVYTNNDDGVIGWFIIFTVVILTMLFCDLYWGTTSLVTSWNWIYATISWIYHLF